MSACVAAALLFAVSAAGAAQTLEVWLLDEPWAAPEIINECVDRFEAETGIDTERVSLIHCDLHPKFPVAVAAGASPDVLIADSSGVLNWAAGTLLAPIDRFIDLDNNPIVPGKVQESTFGGKLYALPFDFQVRGLYWNADLFQEAGLGADQPPTTLAELDEYAVTTDEDRG